MTNLQKRLRAMRDEAGSVAALAAKLRLSRQAVYELLAGADPKHSTLVRLRELGVVEYKVVP